MWYIGNQAIQNKVVFAPMAGISNPSYMKILEEMKIGYAITELISAEAIVRNNKKTFEMLNGIRDLKIPVAVQIFGSNPDTMAKASRILSDLYQIQLIDINMGCPVPKVASRAQAGSALLKDPSKVYKIVKAVVNAVSIPVTIKIRSGWDSNSINAPMIAKTAEKAGAKAVTVHARTRAQGYTGVSDWNIIKDVKESVSIPVIGNGDVQSYEDAERMIEKTGCDAVMIGRAAIGNPWLIRDTVCYLEGKDIPNAPTLFEKLETMRKHLSFLCKYRGEKIAILEMRTHASYYVKGMPDSKLLKENIFKVKSQKEFLDVLDTYERRQS